MMNEYGKSDSSIIPEKLPNKACNKAAEAMEERGLAKGTRISKTHTGHDAGNIRKVRLNGYAEQQSYIAVKRYYLRQEPCALVAHAGICAGGAE